MIPAPERLGTSIREEPSRPFWIWIVFWLMLAAVYALTGVLCSDISAQVANVSWMFYIPSGISLIAALLWGARVWPGIFIGELTMAIVAHQPMMSSVIMAVGNALDAALAGWWFRDRPGRRIEFNRLMDVISLLAAELLVLQPMSAAFGMLAITYGHPLPRAVLASTAGAWYTANLYAQFVMAPVALVWIQGVPPMKRRGEPLELAVFSLVMAAVGAFGYGRWATHGVPLTAMFVLIFPLLVWASIRFPTAVAVTAGSVMGLFAFDAGLAGEGPFAALAVGERMLYLNIFMAVTIASSLFLAAAMGDDRRFEDEQARLIAELREASTQVERLKELVTLCAWTGRVRWQNQWVTIEQFLDERYNVQITHGISEEALDQFLKDSEQARKKEAADKGVPPGPPPDP